MVAGVIAMNVPPLLCLPVVRIVDNAKSNGQSPKFGTNLKYQNRLI